jgi:hypothetical protein
VDVTDAGRGKVVPEGGFYESGVLAPSMVTHIQNQANAERKQDVGVATESETFVT